MQELWLPVAANDKYLVSNLGRVKGPRTILTPQRQRNGYYTVQLGKGRTVSLHRIVALAFIPNPEKLPDVNHDDGDKRNNKITNLVWCTKSDNSRHACASGLLTHLKFSAEEIREIRSSLLEGVSSKTLCSQYKIDYSTLSKIRLRKIYDWVD